MLTKHKTHFEVTTCFGGVYYVDEIETNGPNAGLFRNGEVVNSIFWSCIKTINERPGPCSAWMKDIIDQRDSDKRSCYSLHIDSDKICL